jgi:oxygen-dependent protoporphyrinogen oxidase
MAAAHRLLELAARDSQPVRVTLLEASGRVGGVFGTRDIAGYRVETGADSFITNKPWALDLCLRAAADERLQTVYTNASSALLDLGDLGDLGERAAAARGTYQRHAASSSSANTGLR